MKTNIKYYKSGSIASYDEYIDDYNYISYILHENGKVGYKDHYRNDLIHGICQSFDMKGNLQSVKHYINGVCRGMTTFYSSRNTIQAIIQRKGQTNFHGLSVEFSHRWRSKGN